MNALNLYVQAIYPSQKYTTIVFKSRQSGRTRLFTVWCCEHDAFRVPLEAILRPMSSWSFAYSWSSFCAKLIR